MTDELAYKQDWPEAKRRLEAWWRCEPLDRACIQVFARKKKARQDQPAPPPTDQEELARWWTDPEIVIPRVAAGLESTWFGGEAFPQHCVNLGPTILAAYLGAPLRFVRFETTWPEPIIKDWDNPPELTLEADNRWWKATRELTKASCEAGRGKYIVAMTDIGGVADTLSYLRGPEKLCVDLIEHPDRVHEMEKLTNRFWFQVYDELYEIVRRYQEGTSTWLGVWHPGRTYILQCDFSYMISPRMFDEFFLPRLRDQSMHLDRTIYHLDGPGAVCHLDSILQLPRLRAIQWVPGAGGGSMMKWIDLLKRIQSAGKGIHIGVGASEVEAVLEALSPEGLMINLWAESPEHGEHLLRRAREIAAGKKT